MKVFLGTCEIAGYYKNLTQGLRDLGVDAEFWNFTPHPFNYEPKKRGENVLLEILYARHFVCAGLGRVSRFLVKSIFLPLEFTIRLILFVRAAFKFDVFVFGARQTFFGSSLGYFDLVLLKKFGKRLIFLHHGSDTRPPYINGGPVISLINKKNGILKLFRLTKKQKLYVERIDSIADVVIDSPYSGQFHTAPFVSFFKIGIPYSPPQIDLLPTKNQNKVLRILHSPSRLEVKGSDVISNTVNKLRSEGCSIELVTMVNRSNREVLEELSQCDFVIDQLYSDTPMAGFASEAASMGKPVIVCGYLSDKEFLAKFPSYYCHPDSLTEAIQYLVSNVEYREALGHRAKFFFEEQWSESAVSQRFTRILCDDIPSDWWCNPNEIDYVYGAGLPELLSKKSIAALVKRFGVSALQLDDKPRLKKSFLEFAKADGNDPTLPPR